MDFLNWRIFVASAVVIPVLDFVWLGLIAKNFYRDHLRPVANIGTSGSIEITYWAAFAVYVLLALGIAALVGGRIENAENWWQAALWGGLFGFVCYGVYDFTNHATLKTWPLPLLAADIAWGSFVCAAAALASFGLVAWGKAS